MLYLVVYDAGAVLKIRGTPTVLIMFAVYDTAGIKGEM